MKGKQDFQLAVGHHTINAATPIQILVSVNDQPEHVIPPGNSKFVLKVEQPVKVSLDPADAKSQYKFEFRSHGAQRNEHFDDRPLPNPPPPNNFLKKLRVNIRRQMGLIREDFADYPSMYEIEGDPDKIPFEEQEQRAIKEAKEARDKQKKEEEDKKRQEQIEQIEKFEREAAEQAEE